MTEERVQRRLAAILAADVVGYSRMMGVDEEGTLARLNALRRELLHPKIAEYNGRIVKTTGDGTLIEFPSAVDAVQHAVDVQQMLVRLNADLGESERIEIRIGINVGDVIIDNEDIFGDGVNVAARLEALADPGGICISGTVYDQVRGKLHLPFRDSGEQLLKNIAEPVRVIAISIEPDTAEEESSVVTDAVFRRPAVAVLPFENLSDDPGQDYFADGLTEDIITALSLWRSFPVIARNSSFSYKGTSPDIRTVGRELGARYVIEGSVRKAANRLRVTAQLINAENGHHVWAERYDRELADIFDMQDEITQHIAATVAPELERSEQKLSTRSKHGNLAAWDFFQQGMFNWHKFTKDGIERGRTMFEKAIELDPHYSRAHGMIAQCYIVDNVMGYSQSVQDASKLAIAAARRAIELDDGDPIGHRMLGIAYLQTQQFDQALAEKKIAISLNPYDASAQVALAHSLTLDGRPEEAIPYIHKAFSLNPRDPRNHVYMSFMARAQFTARHYEAAVDWAQKAIQLRPDAPEPHLLLAASFGHMDRINEAKSELEFYRRYEKSHHWLHVYRHEADNEHFLDGLRKAGWEG